MPQLFDPARHQPLAAVAWNADEARAVIRDIVAETVAAFDAEKLWPGHPLDAPIPGGTGGAYAGAAGIVWALDWLKREGAADYAHDFRPALPRILEADQGWLGGTPFGAYASLFMGDFGPLLLSMRLDPSPARAEAILVRAAANEALPVQDLMWGTAGSALAALWLLDASGDWRFAELFRRQASHLLATLEPVGTIDAWPFTLYGGRAHYLGLAHGFAGNILPLLRRPSLLTGAQNARVQTVALALLAGAVIRDGDAANWPADLDLPEAPLLLQICHGAPGIVAAFADAPFSTPELEQALVAGGEAIWHAGPLAKGSNFCHGTGGNGYALLKLHVRTKDALWLERARAFAMAAISQYRAARAEHGQGRFSLWTGDPGLAVFLWNCVTGRAYFPTLDGF